MHVRYVKIHRLCKFSLQGSLILVNVRMLKIATIGPIHVIWYCSSLLGVWMRVLYTDNIIVLGTAIQSAYGNKD